MSEELASAGSESTALDFGDFGNLGKEDVKPEDLSTPYIKLLQAGSKQEQEIEAAKAGDFYNSVTGELTKAQMVAEKQGLIFAVVKILTMYVEGEPYENNGGKYIASHYPDSDFVKNAIEKNDGKAFGKIPCADGKHELVETKYVCGFTLTEDGKGVEGYAILPCSSTKLGPLKKWQTSMYTVKVGNAPLFAFRSQIRSVLQSNKKGKDSWNITVTPFGGGTWKECLVNPNEEWGVKILTAGKLMLDAIESGKISVDFQMMDEDNDDQASSASGAAADSGTGTAPY